MNDTITHRYVLRQKGRKMDQDYSHLIEKQRSSELIFDGTILHVYRDDIDLPDGGSAEREIIRHIGAVCIVPLTDEHNIILEKQFRYAIDQVVTEIPAGKLDYPGEVPLDAAKRELKEETGYSADNWVDLGIFYPAPAYSDEKITMFLATGLKKGEQELDSDEFIDFFEMPLEQAYEKVMNGEITDIKTQMGILKAVNILGDL